MTALLESMGPDFANVLIWTLFALIGLLALLVIIRIVRSLTFGTFVAGGKNRKARLAVMDATAVDSQRRLVLVRRDDIEHLILIGGPTDVVVEQNIRLLPPSRRPMTEERVAAPSIEPAGPAIAQPKPEKQPATRFQQPVPSRPAQQQPAQPQPTVPRPVTRPAPQHAQEHFTAPSARTQAYRPTTPAPAPEAIRPKTPASTPREAPATVKDNELLQELRLTLETDRKQPSTQTNDAALDEEMGKLLSELPSRRS